MKRRDFIRKSAYSGAFAMPGIRLLAESNSPQDIVIGHGDFRYKIDLNWGALNAIHFPVKDCHEMVQDSQGRMLLLTNHIRNNVIIYDKSGRLIETWGNEYPGAHGLTLNQEGGKDFLYIADNERHEVIKTDLKGNVMMTLPCPLDAGKYTNKSQYIPTETAVATNGDIYVADGYGAQYILHYDERGHLKNVFGGRGDSPAHFSNAHGICIDTRAEEPSLLITDRMVNCLKRFTLSGEYLETIHLPGAFICRPVIHGKQVYLATIWSGDGSSGSGFISILNEDNDLVSAPGGSDPQYLKGSPRKARQTIKLFHHPHDVCIDEDENLYIPQWNSFGSYPIKLIRTA